MPDFNEDVVLLNFSPIEAVLYDDLKDSSNNEELQQLCCKLPHHLGKTLNLIREDMLESKKASFID